MSGSEGVKKERNVGRPELLDYKVPEEIKEGLSFPITEEKKEQLEREALMLNEEMNKWLIWLEGPVRLRLEKERNRFQTRTDSLLQAFQTNMNAAIELLPEHLSFLKIKEIGMGMGEGRYRECGERIKMMKEIYLEEICKVERELEGEEDNNMMNNIMNIENVEKISEMLGDLNLASPLREVVEQCRINKYNHYNNEIVRGAKDEAKLAFECKKEMESEKRKVEERYEEIREENKILKLELERKVMGIEEGIQVHTKSLLPLRPRKDNQVQTHELSNSPNDNEHVDQLNIYIPNQLQHNISNKHVKSPSATQNKENDGNNLHPVTIQPLKEKNPNKPVYKRENVIKEENEEEKNDGIGIYIYIYI